jgi:hypothetical protein
MPHSQTVINSRFPGCLQLFALGAGRNLAKLALETLNTISPETGSNGRLIFSFFPGLALA